MSGLITAIEFLCIAQELPVLLVVSDKKCSIFGLSAVF